MKIGRKLVLTFILISLISSISGVVGFSMMKTMARQYSVVLEKYGFSQGDVGLFNTEFNNNNVIMRDIILQGTVADKLKNKEQLDQSSVKLNQYLARMKTSMVSGDEQNYYNTILDCLQQYAVARDQVVQLAISEDSQKASKMMAQDCTPLVSKMRTAIDALVTEKTATGDRLANGLTVQEKNAEGLMAAVVLFSILLSVVIAVLISRGISKPVAELLKTAEKIAQGDLKTQVTVKSENEIGRLARAFAETVRSINRYITDIETKLREVEQGNLRVDDGFAVVADEVRSLAGKSSDAAKETRILIRNSMSEVRGGKKTVNETAASLLRVVENAGSVFESVSRISDATEKQSEAVKAVNADVKRIADVVQTNSATAEESAAASEELAGQAQVMKSLSEKFSLREDIGGGEEKKSAQFYLVAGR